MERTLRILGITSAFLSFTLCLVAGLWILATVGFKTDDDAIWTAMAFYFIGKAFFVGPMLLIVTVKSTHEKM